MKSLGYKHNCVLCNQACQNSDRICGHCMALLPVITSACFKCGQPLSLAPAELCGSCLQNPPRRHRTLAAFKYRFPVDKMIVGFKFLARFYYLPFLTTSLAERIRIQYANDALPQTLIPVPLHNRRLRERGFNQSLLIAKQLSRQLNIPVNNRICSRKVFAAPQMHLPAQKRFHNVESVFRFHEQHYSRTLAHIAIVDDVLTTGATVESLAQLLLSYGVQRVDVWCVARA